MSSGNAGSGLYGDSNPFNVVNSDDDMSTTKSMVEKITKKKRPMARESEKGPTTKKSKNNTSSAEQIEAAKQGEETIPPLTKKEAPVEKKTRPSTQPLPMSVVMMKHAKRSSDLRRELAEARAERDQALIEKKTLEERNQQLQAKEIELASVQTQLGELKLKLQEYCDLHISKEDLNKWYYAFWWRMLSSGGMTVAVEEINTASMVYGGHAIAVEGLKRLKSKVLVKAKWLKQFLKENPKKTMYEALVQGLCKLSMDQLPLWEPVCEALSKMSSPENIVSFPGDVASIFTRGPTEELAIPEVSDGYFGIDLEEDEDETAEEDDTGNSGAKDQDLPIVGDTRGAEERNPPTKESSENHLGNDSRSQTAVQLMILDENQAKNFLMYAMVSTAMRKLGNVHSNSAVRTLEKEIVDAMQAYNVQIHSRLVHRFKQKEEEYQRYLQQYDLDYQDSLILEANVSEEMANLRKENAQLKHHEGIMVSPWFLEKFHILSLVEKQIRTRIKRFIAAIEMLKKRTKEAEFYSRQSVILLNMIADREIPLPIFEDLDEKKEARERTTTEEFLLRLDEQDWELVDLKDKLSQCFYQLRVLGFSGVIKPF
ncbi:OLC1v1023652C1 [Oldenlandia corymbosa var. corymbosa]|uniref:OLC1v1023652C1 n=1 Tax=Oldenlandia corymbosa var. corymbosa TaxID=529605 RepID=A0AAV1C2X2_OLDCO|nr:OLC1v1023652C1 [Oldenlandia corymbosa var. corymbosa]